MKKLDKLLYAVLAVIFLASSAVSGWVLFTGRQVGGLVLDVQIDGDTVDSIPLSELRSDKTFEISGDRGYNAFSAGPDGVKMVSSDCRGGDCLSMPSISVHGAVIACLPHKLILRLHGKIPDKDSVDVVSY